MFKSTLRKVLFTTLVASLTCATLVGINAAFGAPSEAPPGNTISPTFDNVNVNNDLVSDYIHNLGNADFDSLVTVEHLVGTSIETSNLQVNNDADITGDLTADNVSVTTLLDAADLQTGDLSVTGSVITDIVFDGGLDVLSGLFSVNSGGFVTVDGDMEVTTGNLNLENNLDVAGNTTFLGPVDIGDTDNAVGLDIYGDTTLENGQFTANGQINANNGLALTNTGGTSLAVTGPAIIDGSLAVGASTSPAATSLNGQLFVYGDTTTYGTLNVGTSTSNNDLVVNGNTDVIGSLDVDGKITGDQLGTFTYDKSSVLVNPGSYGTLSAACPEGEYMVSCGGRWGYYISQDIASFVSTVDERCYVEGENNSVHDEILSAYYVCHNGTYAFGGL
ncbi:hypothetical protein GF354_04320 [Candidatus Peregrinibacteria bacterium]|nr:hypothetical protein [Candidatus Peregrinibacteria bacterium]